MPGPQLIDKSLYGQSVGAGFIPPGTLTPKSPFPGRRRPLQGILPRLRSAPRGSGTPQHAAAGQTCIVGGLHVHIAVTTYSTPPSSFTPSAAISARVPSGAGFVGTSGRAPRTISNRLASKYRATTARANSSALLENTAIRTRRLSAGPAVSVCRGRARSCRAYARRILCQTRPAWRPAGPGCGSRRG